MAFLDGGVGDRAAIGVLVDQQDLTVPAAAAFKARLKELLRLRARRHRRVELLVRMVPLCVRTGMPIS
jgi:hypothetical protein